MQIYFVHKKTKIEVSLQRLKDEPYSKFHFGYTNPATDDKYYARDIPLSDDFELKSVDDNFTEEEYEQIRSALHFNNYNLNYELIDKVTDKMIELLKYERNK